MRKETFHNTAKGAYETPLCSVMPITAEGIMTLSGNVDDGTIKEWGEDSAIGLPEVDLTESILPDFMQL